MYNNLWSTKKTICQTITKKWMKIIKQVIIGKPWIDILLKKRE